MSYILFSSGSSLATPVSIANGGTGSTNASDAMEALTTTEFASSSQSTNWGGISITAPSEPFDADQNATAIIDLIDILTTLGVLSP